MEEEITPHVQAEKATVVTSVISSTPSPTAPVQPRAVAKKSTAKRQTTHVDTTTTYNSAVETKPSHSIVVSK